MRQRTIIIAEAGVNHNGSMENAFKLVDAAVNAGVDYIKFQTFKAEKLVSKHAQKADYQIQNTGNSESQFQMLKKLELSQDQHERLMEYCQEKGISFFSTAFDLDSLKYLKEIGLDIVKIPSGEITNYPYLKLAAELFDRAIISTGMSTMEDIEAALQVFLDAGLEKENIVILHCNTEYPTPYKDVNLKAMNTIAERFGTAVGYSDHTLGIEIPVAAVSLGAEVIEKHFTLSKEMEGPDHKASLEPDELKAMVSAIRNVESALSGSGLKEPSESEMKNIAIGRKSIVAAQRIKKGDFFSDENLTTKRPGTGVSPMRWNEVIGKQSQKNYEEDQLIEV